MAVDDPSAPAVPLVDHPGSSMSDPATSDLLNPQDLSNEANIHRIMARYYGHIEELGSCTIT